MIEVVYFTGKDCGVCQVVKPKLQQAIEESYSDVPFNVIDIQKEPHIAAQNMVFTLPVVIVKQDGKEAYRFARSFGMHEVLEKISRLISFQ